MNDTRSPLQTFAIYLGALLILCLVVPTVW